MAPCNYLLSALGNEASAAVEGLLDNPPADNKYNTLKAELIKVYGLTDKQKKRMLISLSGLGDRKPTELLRFMKSLHCTTKNGPLFMALFMQQLPPAARTILVSQDFDDIDDLATAADEVMLEQMTINAVHTNIQQKALSVRQNQASQAQQDGLPSTLCWYHRKYAEKATRCRQPRLWQGNASASH